MQSTRLRWRLTCIRAWRNFRDMTLEGVAERLERPPYRIETTHNSLGRVERGQQMPQIGLIEALADIYSTDVHSLLNRRPESEDAGPPSAGGIMSLWDRADPEGRELITNLAKRVVRTGGQ